MDIRNLMGRTNAPASGAGTPTSGRETPTQSATDAADGKFRPWDSSLKGVEWEGVSADEFGKSACKADAYDRPSLPRGGAPAKIWSYGALISGTAPGTQNWRCLHRMQKPDGTYVACGKAVNYPTADNIWNGVRAASSVLVWLTN